MKQQEMVKIPMHSIIDLITNSSTEIFVHSENSLKPCKELINEFLKITGSDKTCDDMFDLSIEIENYSLDTYRDYYLENDIEEEVDNTDKDSNELKDEFEKYIQGKIEKPSWVNEYHLETRLILKSKDPKYTKLAELFKDFLYSPDWYEHSND